MPWPALVASAVVLAAGIVAAGIVADRGIAVLATRLAARRMAAVSRAAAAPRIRVPSAPFTTQLLSGKYREVEITLAALRAGGLDLVALSARLTRLRAPLGALLCGGGLIASQLTARATVPYAALAARLPPGLTISPYGDDLRVSGAILRMPVAGTLGVRAERQQIRVTPKVAGVPSLVGFVIGLPAMPPQLVIESVRVTSAGLEVSVRGHEVVLAPDGSAGRAGRSPGPAAG